MGTVRRVVVSGPTASGKTTITAHLSEVLGIRKMRGSSFLLSALSAQPRSRRERLLSWLDAPHDTTRAALPEKDRRADLMALSSLLSSSEDVVMESATVPLLVSPFNGLLCVWLDASAPVRAARLDSVLPDVDLAKVELILHRKDQTTADSMRRAWGVDRGDPETWRWRFDLVLACPHGTCCAEPVTCETATARLVRAAYAVYGQYVRHDGAANARAALNCFAEECSRYAEWVVRVSPLLVPGHAGPYSARRWHQRLWEEVAPATADRIRPKEVAPTW